MFVEVGDRVLVSTGGPLGGGGSLVQRHCSLSAKLKDPEAASEMPLVLITATGDEITLTDVEGRDRLRSGEFLTQGGVANVRLH